MKRPTAVASLFHAIRLMNTLVMTTIAEWSAESRRTHKMNAFRLATSEEFCLEEGVEYRIAIP